MFGRSAEPGAGRALGRAGRGSSQKNPRRVFENLRPRSSSADGANTSNPAGEACQVSQWREERGEETKAGGEKNPQGGELRQGQGEGMGQNE